MQSDRKYDIAVIYGDGIGPEVCAATVEVLKAATGAKQPLNFIEYPGGAGAYLKTGKALPDETYAGCLNADAILHGAAGLPNAVYADGTEVGMDFGLVLRAKLDLYANIRYSKLYPGTTSHLRYAKPGDIDYVVLRENVEGLYASRGGGVVLRDVAATDTLVVTREGTERIARMAFELARKRNGAPADGKRRVTVCDKANVLRSYAFFRKVCAGVAKEYPDVEVEYTYVDALSAFLVTRPSHYDVIVAENMFGDIISDLAAATVGGLGISPTAELGDTRGYFQAAHGSAPDIAGQGIANPLGTILSGVLMLEWLSEKHGDAYLAQVAGKIRNVIEKLLADGAVLTRDLGGTATTKEVTNAICSALK
ncbi:MAG: isocitrate/isopropylmalate dehydrogenase family protein [Spirochaetales bacterium]|nr:isocitrate/isopropylmalate dehydrogenase family protein [Spirochaetales bacterium]